MDDALIRRFLPRFIDTARGRLQRSRALLDQGEMSDAVDLITELHTLAGEAAILGLRDISALAHEAETEAAHAAEPGPARGACERKLAELETAVAALAARER